MTAYDIAGLARQTPIAGEYGNLCVARKKVASTDYAQNDTIDLLRLPKGSVIIDAILVHGAFGSSVVADLGIVAVNAGAKGVADCLMDGADVAAAGIKRRTEVGIYSDSDLTLDDDDYDVRLTLAGANPDAAAYEVIVLYEFVGTK